MDFDVPMLAVRYRDAMKNVYHCSVRVPEEKYPRFAKRETELRHAAIGLEDYSVTVSKMWKWWVAQQRLRCLPVNIFLGPKSKAMYVRSYPVDLVSNDADKAIILNDELILATLCITREVPERIVIENIILSELWKAAYERGQRPISDVSVLLCKLYGLECTTTSYVEIGELLRGNKIQMEQRLSRAYTSTLPQK
jgi:hypothetical protein